MKLKHFILFAIVSLSISALFIYFEYKNFVVPRQVPHGVIVYQYPDNDDDGEESMTEEPYAK